MYIKIKYIKQFLLIAACIFFAGFNYLTYVKADDAINNTAIDADKDGLTDAEEKLYGTDEKKADSDGDGYSDGVEVKSGYDPTKPPPGDKIVSLKTGSTDNVSNQEINVSATDNFAKDFQAFVSSKGNGAISTTDVNEFVSEKLADKVGTAITMESLPAVDYAQIKILKQEYSSLGEAERKKKMQEDALAYYTKVIYVLVSNAPRTMITNNDFVEFRDDFFARAATLASPTVDSAYFLDLAERLDLVLNQVNEIEVPESMIELHVKSIRIVKGFLALRDDNADIDNDPIAKMALISKVQNLADLTTEYLKVDFAEYVSSIE